MILEQIQRQRAKTMTSATPKKIIDSSKIKVIEEIKETPPPVVNDNSSTLLLYSPHDG